MRRFGTVGNKSSELMREFIHDSLYNSQYGYFSRNVNIFDSPQTIPFRSFRDQDDYYRALRQLYSDATATCGNESGSFRQLWHTPSELFKPFYGRAITNFLTTTATVPGDRLIIYEIGPGNGTLAENILDSLQVEHPTKYSNTEYHIIEISEKLRNKQAARLSPRHGSRVHFHPDVSILTPPAKFKEERACWILAMEVLDNLSHDLVKFRNSDGVLLEARVLTDPKATYGSVPGKYWHEFQVARDPLILEYARLADELDWKWPSLQGRPIRRALENFGPFEYINPWSCEFIPTGSLQLLKSLVTHFPRHSLLCSDFDALPDTVAGHNGPVVQTRFRGVTVPCSSVLLERGLFDIFFATDFVKLAQIHAKLRPPGQNAHVHSIQKHAQFLKTWSNPADLHATTTAKSSFNPMLHDFENVSFYTFRRKGVINNINININIT